ncbi:hypothetical protein JAAARDRAFT_139901 [Jaapia argillacea MUCL 33604]|uniref:DDE-1 domain-containing protein n=1 Tax=Jaapia argillacea MUCL 33604 TaxID=933084 RepID=A0A067P9P3_9AGAM|nr:hypothetical protein JAAARDRAFT_139901 [Jaapia argillacea MUCL 33604]
MRRHREVLKFCGTSGLDPKRAQAFNPNVMADYFKKLKAAMDEHQYELGNIYNFDETGMQIGGGRKRTGKKFFIPRSSRARYRKRDGNLELVTVVECACADGTMLEPGFIFQGKMWDRGWVKNHPDIS